MLSSWVPQPGREGGSPVDEPTPGELMRAIQEIKSLFRDLSGELARSYVRIDVYEERARAFGERVGRVENDQSSQDQRIKETKEIAAEAKTLLVAEFTRRDAETKKMRILIWTSLGSPLLLMVIAIGIDLARN